MDNENKVILQSDGTGNGPKDGTQMVTNCIRTDFTRKKSKNHPGFKQRPMSKARISASTEVGVFSIRDMSSGVMLSVNVDDAIEVLAAMLQTQKQEQQEVVDVVAEEATTE